jgi:glycosyltransferase involved in cell wall biosynthesis
MISKSKSSVILSIITINKNNLIGFKKTFQSLLPIIRSDFKSIEWIIVDGGSSFSETHFIEKSVKNFSKVKLLKGPDSGIFEGMNKGLSSANGTYVLFLNSGDFLLDSSNLFLDFVNTLKDESAEWLVGNVKAFSPGGDFEWDWYFPLNWQLRLGIFSLPHQATLAKRTSLKRFGGFILNSYYADWAMSLVFHKFFGYPKMTSLMNVGITSGGISSQQTLSYWFRESHKLRVKTSTSYCRNVLIDYCVQISAYFYLKYFKSGRRIRVDLKR